MSSNNNNKDDNIISLDLGKLEKEGIIQHFVKNKSDNYIEIELNHKYDESSIIVPTDIIKRKKEGWIIFKNLVEKELKDLKISKEHIIQIRNVLTRNYKLVSEIYNDDNSNHRDYDGDESEGEGGGKDGGEEKERISLSQILVELVLENCVTLLKDEFNVPHIRIMLQGPL